MGNQRTYVIALLLCVFYISAKVQGLQGFEEDCKNNDECDSNLECTKKDFFNSKKCHCTNDLEWFSDIERCENKDDYANHIMEVRQNYRDSINDKIVAQIIKELQASYIYQAYASYFARADVSLPGVKKFFSAASLEERDHAQMLIDYVNQRGGHAQFDNIKLVEACQAVLNDDDAQDVRSDDGRRMCICSFVAQKQFKKTCGERPVWQSAKLAFEDALATERFVNRLLLDLHKAADAAGDAHLSHILEHHFLEEQVASIADLAAKVTRLRSFKTNYALGEYIFDQNLQK